MFIMMIGIGNGPSECQLALHTTVYYVKPDFFSSDLENTSQRPGPSEGGGGGVRPHPIFFFLLACLLERVMYEDTPTPCLEN